MQVWNKDRAETLSRGQAGSGRAHDSKVGTWIAIGAGTGNIGVGIAMGIGIGVAIGLAASGFEKKKPK